MSTEACTLALRNALNEIKNVCPEITNTFIFRENGEIVAEDQDTTQEAIDRRSGSPSSFVRRKPES